MKGFDFRLINEKKDANALIRQDHRFQASLAKKKKKKRFVGSKKFLVQTNGGMLKELPLVEGVELVLAFLPPGVLQFVPISSQVVKSLMAL